ncbi:MAG: S1C family serine protease [Solirubrobacteraceae bacterium]|nr:S1C family serine protease [Solirubrobacteraceae bacterium]
MFSSRPSVLAALVLGAGALTALSGCGDGDDAAKKGSTPDSAAARAAKVPGAAGGTLTEGAVRGGLPSVVSVSVSSGGVTRTGSGTLLATGVVAADATLVTTPSGLPAAGVSVREGNGEEHAGVVEGVDELTGLAAVRVRDLTAVPVAKTSEMAAVLGQEVAGLGFVSARRPAIRPGNVVTTDRAVRSQGIAEVGLFEATSALGSQGFGGPVVDAKGEVVGIATRALPSIVPGTVVAIPIRSAQRIAKALAERGRVRRAYLGLETVGITPTRAQELGLKTSTGVIIRSIVPGSPAAFVGLKKPTGTQTIGGREIPSGGDIVVMIDRSRVDEPEDLDRAMANRAPGRRVILKVINGNTSRSVGVTLSQR